MSERWELVRRVSLIPRWQMYEERVIAAGSREAMEAAQRLLGGTVRRIER